MLNQTRLTKSTTGDFTELRRSAVAIETQPVSQSVLKRRARVPRRIINLTPLNLNEIRKEVESDKGGGTETFPASSNNDDLKTTVDEIDTSLTDISNKNLNNEWPTNKVTTLNEVPVIKVTKANDSFDLNFSALSLVTPIKKHEPLPKEVELDVIKRKTPVVFNNFITPKVDRGSTVRTQHSATKTIYQSSTRRPSSNHFRTPIIEDKENEIFLDEENKCLPNHMYSTNTSLPNTVFQFEKLIVKNVEYLILNKIGKGGSSEVFACFCPENKIDVAIKCVTLENPVNATGYINEVKLLQKLQNCDKIIKMYDYEIFEKEKKLLVVLERGGEDLSTILKNIAAQKSHIPFYMLFFYWMEMLHAVKQIHSHGVIHSDLKPANFLKADSGLKLIDFGIASTVQVDMTSVFKTTPEGSCNYISPEALNLENSNSPDKPKYKLHYKSDVWSLGCILYQLVYRKTPFQHLINLWKKLAYIVNPNHVIEFPPVDWVPPKIIDTIKRCLTYDTKSRPSVDELIKEYDSLWCINCFSASQTN